ncbi:MAG TPA: pilus assembly protein TadG-related protein [Thermomicrobiales bacterium]|nr:pilus assembly protein TadG-related protein [Thermomicrobiales bacterium]
MRRQDSDRTLTLPRVTGGPRRRTAGQSLVLFALFGFVLVGFMALAIDGGFILAERRQVQSAADAAALAAARSVLDLRPLQVNPSGQTYGAANSRAGSTVDINWPPLSGPHTGDPFYVEAIVSQPVQQFFVGALYSGDWSVTARAVAGVEPIVRPYALLALRDCASGGTGIYINGSGSVDVHTGSIMSNCNIARSGQSSVVTAGGTIDAAGTIDPGSLWSAGAGYHQRPVVNDPVIESGIVPPSRDAAKTVGNVTTSAQLQLAVTNIQPNGRCPGGATCVMEPGYYGGNLNVDVHGTLQMKPGIYYFGDSFTLTTTSDNAVVQGLGVLLYITDSAAFTPSNAAIHLAAAPTSLYSPNGLDGMVMWIANCTPFMMMANGSFTLEGVLYAPCSQVRLYGSPGSNGVQVIVGNLELSGGGSFDILYTDYISANSPMVFLIE